MIVAEIDKEALVKFSSFTKKRMENWVNSIMEDRARSPIFQLNQYDATEKSAWLIKAYWLNFKNNQKKIASFLKEAVFFELKKRMISKDVSLLIDLIKTLRNIDPSDYKSEFLRIINLKNRLYRYQDGIFNVQYELVILYIEFIIEPDDSSVLLNILQEQLINYPNARSPVFLQRSLKRLQERPDQFVIFLESALEIADEKDVLFLVTGLEDFTSIAVLISWLEERHTVIKDFKSFKNFIVSYYEQVDTNVKKFSNNSVYLELWSLVMRYAEPFLPPIPPISEEDVFNGYDIKDGVDFFIKKSPEVRLDVEYQDLINKQLKNFKFHKLQVK